MAYAKLDTNIIYSTVWSEPPETVKVWFTLMAMADRDGYVGASIDGIVRVSLVSEALVLRAMQLFLSPDPKSRTKEWEGRRLVEVDGGWRLLNYAKYRDAQSAEERKEAAARRQRDYIARKTAKEEKEREVLERAAGVTSGKRSLLTRNDAADKTDKNDPSDQAQAQDQAQSSLRPGSGSGVDCSRLGKDEIQSQNPPAGDFDAEAAWRQTKEVWGNAGTWPGGENLVAAKEKFLTAINASNWAEFSQGLDWAVTNSQNRHDRKWLGVLCTFLDEDKWKEQSNPYKTAPEAAPPPQMTIPVVVDDYVV